MTTFRDAILPALDTIRGIPDTLGLRRFTVTSVVRTWSGTRVGLGTNTDAPSKMSVSLGNAKIRVRQLSQKEIVASGGFYADQDLRIGPITPPYTGSAGDNNSIGIFDPEPSGGAVELFFHIEGPEMPAGGLWMKKISQTVTLPLHFEFVVRHTGERP